MNYKLIGKFMARIVAIEAVFLLVPIVISLSLGEYSAVKGFALTLLIMAVVGAALFLLCRRENRPFGPRDGMVCVAASWVTLSLLGCLPFVFSGEIPRFIDAFFETVSGFTTTGASVLSDVESLSKGLLYWRSFTHWVGGMGVLVFLLAVTQVDGREKGITMHLLRAESPGPDVGKLVPKMRNTATILYLIYIGLTVVNVIFLLIGGMSVFEAVCTAFGTAGTGGFGIKNDSMAGFSPYLQNVTSAFMFLFGINFSCYFLLLMRQIKGVIKDEELRLYIGVVVAAVAVIVFNTMPLYDTLEETIRHAAFQVSSIMTTTGYSTTDFDQWPQLSKGVLMMLMVIGACAGSTGGGIKCARVLLLWKSLRRNIRRALNPRKVMVVRSNGKTVDEKVLENTNAYLAAYVVILIVSCLLISIDNFSAGTNLSAVLACFNNIGPGIEAVGPTCNFSAFSDLSKFVLIADMLAGRLEIFPILILFSRSAWKR